MADLVPPEDIERIVGAERQEHAHLARLVSAEDRIYVLHSHDCVRETPDLRDCPVSLALDRGEVNSLLWSEWADAIAHPPVQRVHRTPHPVPAFPVHRSASAALRPIRPSPPGDPMNTHDLPLVYSTLDVKPHELGCIMLNVAPVNIALHLNLGWRDHLYTSPSPALPHVAGVVADQGAHLTLLYCLLDGVQRAHVDQVLVGWQPPKTVTVADVIAFPSPLPDTEPYSCIVATLDVDEALADAHARLSLLPHIDTHPTYRPHVTLAYVDNHRAREFVSLLGQGLRGTELTTTGLNYGDRIGRS